MADTILNGDFTINYLDDNRQKRISWTGSADETRTVNELYSALQDLFDESMQMDDGIPMSAQTPVEYTLGIIDSGDLDPWYITYDAMEHLTGGAVKSNSWARVEDSNVGIIIVPVTSAGRTIVAADIGYTISMDTDNDSGTLLDILDLGETNDYLVIRPDTDGIANSFNNDPTAGDGMTSSRGAFTATQALAALTGEQIWANFYTVTPIESNTHIYLYQGIVSDATRARIFAIADQTKDWWSEGTYDRCVYIRDFTTAAAPIIDSGYVTAFVRKGTTLFDNFELQASNTSGGRNPIPLSAASDLNNTTGTGNIVWDNASTDTLVDLEQLFNVGTTTVGNLVAGVAYDVDGAPYTDDTTDLNDVGGGGDVDVFPATEAENDAFYFGMTNQFTYLMVDVATQGVAGSASTIWEYYDGTTWSTLTVTDDSDSGNGAFTQGTGRYLLSWTAPSDWRGTNVTNEPAAITTPIFYIRVRIISGFNYTTVPLLETAWAAGQEQLKGIVRDSAITGAAATDGNTDYFLVGDPQTDFSDNDVFIAGTSRKLMDVAGAPTAQGPALASWFSNAAAPSISFGEQNYDIDDDSVLEGWSIDVDCNSNPLTEVYEWLKYITRNGETSTGNTDGIEGEQYEGGTVFIDYGSSAVSGGTIGEGDDVTQETTGASGVVISHNTTDKEILLRNTRGTFATGGATDYTITSTDNSGAVEMDSTDSTIATTFAANKQSPFGALAGGVFFGARGVLLSNWIAADENSFQLTDITGTVRTRPVAITITVTNLTGTDETTTTDDRVGVFRLLNSGGSIGKTEYSAAGGEAIGDATLVVDTAIASDVPGKTAGGVLRIRDADNNNQEYRLRYDSWSTSTFTLSNIDIASADAGTNTTTVVEFGVFSNAKRGDLVLNKTQSNAVSYVTAVGSSSSITISPAITSQTTADAIEINAVPITMNTADDVFVPLIDQYATASTASVSIVYGTPIYYRVRVRNVANSTKIVPFSTDDVTSGTDRSVATIRTTDTIYT